MKKDLLTNEQIIQKAKRDAQIGIINSFLRENPIYLQFHKEALNKLRNESQITSLSKKDLFRAEDVAYKVRLVGDRVVKSPRKYLDNVSFVKWLLLQKNIDIALLKEEYDKESVFKTDHQVKVVIEVVDNYHNTIVNKRPSIYDIRQIKFYLLKYKLGLTHKLIAELLYSETRRKNSSSGPDHTTVLCGIRDLKNKVQTEPDLKNHLENIKKIIDQTIPLRNFYPW